MYLYVYLYSRCNDSFFFKFVFINKTLIFCIGLSVRWNVREPVEELIYWAIKCPCRTLLFSPIATWAKTVDLRVTAWPWMKFEPVIWFWNKDLDPCLTWAFPQLLCFTALPVGLSATVTRHNATRFQQLVCSHDLSVWPQNCCMTLQEIQLIKDIWFNEQLRGADIVVAAGIDK